MDWRIDTHLVEETLTALAASGLTSHDVRWVGSASGEYAISWEAFASIAAGVVYDPGCGDFDVNEIAADLVVVGDSWWLERWVRGGEEGWRYKMKPRHGSDPKRFLRVLRPAAQDYHGGADTIARLNP